MWTLETRRAYLIKMRFDKNKVKSADDAWVLMMTSHLVG